MNDIDIDRLDQALQRAMDNPMPGDLHATIADEIEPQTMNTYTDHGEVMTCIEIAFPLIRDYLFGEAQARD